MVYAEPVVVPLREARRRWAELRRRIFEGVDPLECRRFGGVMRIVPYPARELPGTVRVPSSHWLDASSTKGDTWHSGKQMPTLDADGGACISATTDISSRRNVNA